MDALEKWSDPNAQKNSIEAINNIVNAPVRVVKTLDEMKVDLEGFEKKDYYHETPFVYIIQNITAGDRDAYDELIGHVLGYCIALKQVKIAKKEAQRLITDFEKKYPGSIPPKPEKEAAKEGFSGLDEFFDDDVTFGKFLVNDDGITANIAGEDIVVCMNPIIISERRENINSHEESIEIAFRLPVETTWRRVVIPTEKAFTKAGIVKALASRCCDVTEDSAKYLIAFLRYFRSKNLDKIKYAKVSEKLGWMDNKQFVPFTSDVSFDSARAGANAEIGESLRAHGDSAVWIDGIKKFRALPTSLPSRIMMAGSASAPIVGLLKVLPFWVHMTGNGTTGKSVTMRMCATIWGYAPLNGGWMQTMNTTVNSLEDLANFSNNLPLCLNELQLLQRKDPRAFAEFVYRMCEGNGRRRLGRDALQKKAGHWYTTVLSCGEDHVVTEMDRGGALSRVIDLVVDEPIMPKDELKPFCERVLDTSYGHAGKQIIEALAKMDTDNIRKEIADITDRLSKMGKATKQVDSAAILLWADMLLEKVVFKDGVLITNEEILSYLKTEEEIDDDLKAFNRLKSIVSENINNFVYDRPVLDDNGEQRKGLNGKLLYERMYPKGRAWGMILDDGNTVRFDGPRFTEEIMRCGYDPVRLVRYCLKKGYVEDGHTASHSSATKQYTLTPGAPKSWCYVFHFEPVTTSPVQPAQPVTTSPAQSVTTGGFTDVTEQTELPF